MKSGLPVSIGLHTALLAWAFVSLPGAKTEPMPVVDAMPVEFVSIGEASQLRLGDKSAKPKEEIVPTDAKQAQKETEGKRAGTSKLEEPPPAPPEQKPQQVAAVPPPEDPKPEPPRPPEPLKAEVKPEPRKAETKPETPVEAEKVKEPPKDAKTLEEIVDKAAKEPAKKPTEKKPDPVKKPEPVKTAAVQPAPQKSQFNSRDISEILNKQQTGTAAAKEARAASLGSPTGRNAAIKMTQTEIDALIGQIKRCWNPPIGAAEANLTVALRFSLNQDGSLNGEPQIIQGPAHPLGPSLARSAQRALLMCGPYRMPSDKFATWQSVEATFDPRSL